MTLRLSIDYIASLMALKQNLMHSLFEKVMVGTILILTFKWDHVFPLRIMLPVDFG